MNVRAFLRPDSTKLLVSVILIILSLLVVTGREWTTKVTFRENRGAPLPFLTLEVFGPGEPCYRLGAVRLWAIPVDILIIYLMSCGISLALDMRRSRGR